jgi:DMSO/TMAO reductase YedYZ heme-binding membrane subunit
MIVLGLSYYARRRIGIARWKVIHRFTLLVWLGGLVHTFSEGTDAGSAWFILLILGAAAPTVALLGARVARPAARSDAIMRAWKRKSSSGSPATRPSSAR